MDREPSLIVVIGASAGGVSALRELVKGLLRDFDGALFIVLHSAPESPGRLPLILSRSTELHVAHAADGDPIEPGRVYVAPPDRHLVVSRGHVHLTNGPRENGARPAVDPLFRSAAAEYGARAVGVVLSGTLDDGTAGLLAIEHAGGVTVVQDPDEALFPDMPLNATRFVNVHHVLPIEKISGLLRELNANPPVGGGSALDARDLAAAPLRLDTASGVSCPECDGSLWSISLGDLFEYRCLIGHRYSPESLLHHLGESSDRIVQAGLRSLEEQATLTELLAQRAVGSGREARASLYERRARRMRARANALRELLARD